MDGAHIEAQKYDYAVSSRVSWDAGASAPGYRTGSCSRGIGGPRALRRPVDRCQLAHAVAEGGERPCLNATRNKVTAAEQEDTKGE